MLNTEFDGSDLSRACVGGSEVAFDAAIEPAPTAALGTGLPNHLGTAQDAERHLSFENPAVLAEFKAMFHDGEDFAAMLRGAFIPARSSGPEYSNEVFDVPFVARRVGQFVADIRAGN